MYEIKIGKKNDWKHFFLCLLASLVVNLLSHGKYFIQIELRFNICFSSSEAPPNASLTRPDHGKKSVVGRTRVGARAERSPWSGGKESVVGRNRLGLSTLFLFEKYLYKRLKDSCLWRETPDGCSSCPGVFEWIEIHRRSNLCQLIFSQKKINIVT